MSRIGHVTISKKTHTTFLPSFALAGIGGEGGIPDVNPLDTFGIKKIYHTKLGGSTWDSELWDNGISRTLDPPSTACLADPYDSRVSLVGTNDPRVIIDGNGIAKFTSKPGVSGSPRLRVQGTWKNVESTIYLRCPSSNPLLECNLRPKTDHYCPGSDILFGGYIIDCEFNDGNSSCRKEKSHSIGYSTEQDVSAVTLGFDRWIGMKGICYNLPDNTVKVEGYFDQNAGAGGGTWVKITEAIDDGTWAGSGGGPGPDLVTCQGSALRSDLNTVDGYLEAKWWTIREIDPDQIALVPDSFDPGFTTATMNFDRGISVSRNFH